MSNPFKPTFGGTGQFPEGKLNADDEGELRFGVAHDQGQVIINFGTPVAWFTMSPTLARELARVLNQHADDIVREGN